MTWLAVAAVLLLAYIAALNTVVTCSVLRDAGRAVEYRLDVLKLYAGVFTRLGRQPVLARSHAERDGQGEKSAAEDLSHDLIVATRADG